MKNKIKLPKGWELKKLENGLYEVMQKTESLENGKDYISIHGHLLIIDRAGPLRNSGFYNGEYFNNVISCDDPEFWHEATKEQVIEFFERHLIERYGEDWEDVKIKECMYHTDDEHTNEGMNVADINKYGSSWMAWNKNGCLFNGKEWAEVLKEKKVTTDLSDIDRPYFIDPYGKTEILNKYLAQTKNHMTSEELCEGILALQQLISFRDDFHKVHGGVYGDNHGSIRFNGNEFMACKIYHKSVEVAIFDFADYEQAEEFYETHKELFNELKKLY